MFRKIAFSLALSSLALLMAACSGAQAPTPTTAPAKPAATTAPAAPAATKPAATAAAAPAATKPAAAPAPTAAPAKVNFPTKAVTIVIAFAAGGSSDVGARVLVPILEKDLGQPVQVVNRAGAGGQVGWTELAKSAPDGHTIGGINLPHLPAVVVDPERQAAFKQEDLIPFASQAVDPTTISVRANEKYKTLKDLVDDAKARPGAITAGIVGILNDDEIGYLQFADAAGVSLRAVRFDGASSAITALLGGHVDVLFCTVGDIFVQTKAGKIHNLAVMEKERVTKFFPDVPTMKELGYGEILSSSTRGFAVPKGVPEPVLNRLEESFVKAMKSPEHITKIEEAGQPVVIEGRQVFQKWYDDSHVAVKKWIGKAIKDK